MEKRVKKARGIALRGLLAGYLLATGALCLALAAAWWVGLDLLMNSGFVYPASTAAEAAAESAQRLNGGGTTAAEVDESDFSPFCRFILIDREGKSILKTNMNEEEEQAFKTLLRTGTGGRVGMYRQFYSLATLGDGSKCAVQYDYQVQYGSPALRGRLPDFQTSYLVLLALGMAGIFAATTHKVCRVLLQDTAKLTAAGKKIAAGDISSDAGEAAGKSSPPQIREYAAALATMDELRAGLAASLQSQWAMEQQRAGQIAALTHDLKTPLTVIGGNAELLAEEKLPAENRQCVEAILRGAGQAGAYLAKLRQISAADAGPAAEPLTPCRAGEFLDACAAAARGLCAPAQLSFVLKAEPAVRAVVFPAAREELLRAMENILENAVRYTPAGGKIELLAEDRGERLAFVVTDGGPGFTPEALRRAGQFLYTADAARPQDGHQGLGLYFARQAAARHGGSLCVANTGHGAEVRVEVRKQGEG